MQRGRRRAYRWRHEKSPSDCPSSIQLVQEGTNAVFNCDTSCEPSTPDDEGYCDCEIDYGSCTAA